MSGWSQENVREGTAGRKARVKSCVERGGRPVFIPSQWRRRGPRRCFSREHRAVGAQYILLYRRGDDDRENDNICSVSVSVRTNGQYRSDIKVSCPLGLVLPLVSTMYQ